MEKLELIKNAIIKELKNEVNVIDPAFNIESNLNIYFQVLKFNITIPTKNDLDGLDKTITDILFENFVESQISATLIGVFCKNFEQFIKKVYYVLEEGEFISIDNVLDHDKLQALTPFLTVLNRIKPIFLDSNNKDVDDCDFAAILNNEPKFKINPDTKTKTFKRLYPSHVSFDKYLDIEDKELNEKFHNNFVLYLIKAVILKNEQSHQAPERSKISNLANLNTTLVAELWIINFFRKELVQSIKKESFKNKDFENYITFELEKYSKQNKKFVSLSLKELKNNKASETSNFIEDIFGDKHHRMRILGHGGSGKTTTIEYLLYHDLIKWRDNPAKCKIPVIIPLSNLKSTQTIIDYISNRINVDKQYIEELLETNDLILYFDGINEIVENRESKKNKLQEISFLLENYPQLKVIITDRYEFDSYQSDMFNIPTFLIQKLNYDQINEFVKKYCDNSIKLSEHVLSVLKSKTNIQELLLRPLVLTRAIEIIKSDNDLPEMEGQIIEKFIDSLLKREKNEKKDPLLNISYFKLLLSFAANEIYELHKANFAIHEFLFNKILVKAAENFGIEKFNAGYITRIGYELEILSKNDDFIQFYHQSYLEFFCKHYLKYELE